MKELVLRSRVDGQTKFIKCLELIPGLVFSTRKNMEKLAPLSQ